MPIDYSKYPDNWHSEIRPRILKRANNCCEFCGLENGGRVFSVKKNGKTYWLKDYQLSPLDIFKPVTVVLTISHLDHDETNKDVKDDRLAALCQLCHLQYDAKEKAKRRKLASIDKNQIPIIL